MNEMCPRHGFIGPGGCDLWYLKGLNNEYGTFVIQSNLSTRYDEKRKKKNVEKRDRKKKKKTTTVYLW